MGPGDQENLSETAIHHRGEWPRAAGPNRQQAEAYRKRIAEAAAFLQNQIGEPPHLFLGLGSGLLGAIPRWKQIACLPYSQIPYWPQPTVSGHPGQLRVYKQGELSIWVLCGRVHLYEGYDSWEVAAPVRIVGLLQPRYAFLTCAAGSMNPSFQPGQLVLVSDHVNLQGTSPLVGLPEGLFGQRHPDMVDAYSKRLRRLARQAAAQVGIQLEEGIYAGVLGPQYETPSEIRFLRHMGADLVGMSIVQEVIALRQMGVETLAVACVTNAAAGCSLTKLDHEHVLQVSRIVSSKLASLFHQLLRVLPAPKKTT